MELQHDPNGYLTVVVVENHDSHLNSVWQDAEEELDCESQTFYAQTLRAGARKALHRDPDAVLLELELPDSEPENTIERIELAAEITAEFPDIHILFMSGYSDRIIDESGNLDYVDQIIRKPIRREKLLDTIAEVFD